MSKMEEKPKAVLIIDSSSNVRFTKSTHPWEVRDFKGNVKIKGD